MNKKFITIVLILVFFSLTFTSVSAISVSVDGKTIDIDSVAVNGKTLVPVRTIFETLGAEVGWDDARQSITVRLGECHIMVTVGKDYILVNGDRRDMGSCAQLINDKTYIPIRAAAEAINCKVTYNEETKTVMIERGELPWTIGQILQGIINAKGWSNQKISMSIGGSINIDGIECAEITAYSEAGPIGKFAVSYDLAYVFEITDSGNVKMQITR